MCLSSVLKKNYGKIKQILKSDGWQEMHWPKHSQNKGQSHNLNLSFQFSSDSKTCALNHYMCLNKLVSIEIRFKFMRRTSRSENGLFNLWVAAKSLQSCPTLCDPIDGSPPGPCQSLGFSSQELWSGLPFPSPMHESEK